LLINKADTNEIEFTGDLQKYLDGTKSILNFYNIITWYFKAIYTNIIFDYSLSIFLWLLKKISKFLKQSIWGNYLTILNCNDKSLKEY